MMNKEEIIAQLRAVIEEYLAISNLELVDLTLRYEGKDLVLRILTDRHEGGITIDECARLNKTLGELLDGKGIMQASYTLEVSSPGLDRPLKSGKDFLRSLNKKAKIFLNELVDGKLEWDGVIIEVTQDAVLVDVNGNRKLLPLSKIVKAKLLF